MVETQAKTPNPAETGGKLQIIKSFLHKPVVMKLKASLYMWNSKYSSIQAYDVETIQVEKREKWKHSYITISYNTLFSGNKANFEFAKASKGLVVFHYYTGSSKNIHIRFIIFIEPQEMKKDRIEFVENGENNTIEIENGKIVKILRDDEINEIYNADVQSMIEELKLKHNAYLSKFDTDQLLIHASLYYLTVVKSNENQL